MKKEIILNKIDEWKIKLRDAQDGSDREIFCNCKILDFEEKLKHIGEFK